MNESEAKSEALIADILAFVRFEGSDHDISIRKAIDRALYHAFGDGYLQCQEDLLEQSLRAMNESGQGEHMGLTK